MIFKVDFEKAFDSVRWDYLDDILKSFGFGDTWRSWISSCLKSAKRSVLVNGSPTSEFQFHKGLKQGDPLSLFLFIMVMESLHRSFTMEAGLFKVLPLYYMSIYKAPVAVLKDLEFIRRNFFNGVDKVDRKISWVHWEKVLASKNNVSLKQFMKLKKISMILKQRSVDLYGKSWFVNLSLLKSSLIKAIHEVKENIDDSQTKISGSIWQELVREFVALKSKGDSVLKMTHPRLFALELKEDITVAEKMGNSSLNLSFRRLTRSGAEYEQYKNLVSITSDVLLPQMHDRWFWSLNASGLHGTKLSKLDRFLILEDATIRLPDVWITALDRDGFDNLIKEEWELLDSNLKCHEKFRRLKDKIKQWSKNIKDDCLDLVINCALGLKLVSISFQEASILIKWVAYVLSFPFKVVFGTRRSLSQFLFYLGYGGLHNAFEEAVGNVGLLEFNSRNSTIKVISFRLPWSPHCFQYEVYASWKTLFQPCFLLKNGVGGLVLPQTTFGLGHQKRIMVKKGGFVSNTSGCGTHIRFWKDIWVGETPLFTRYNWLYHLDQDKDCLIIDRLGPNGTFTVKDARYRIDQNILPTLAHATTWDKSIPRKVNVFMWRLSLDRLPHRLNLSSRAVWIFRPYLCLLAMPMLKSC
ncbi:RNA-directed DNA polymerase, eukaryota, reverse transcriptase zinc-binding domain protein [Tanacetum coccineum]